MNRPRLVLTELREYRSDRTGATYFAGYLGKTRVVMLRDDRAELTGREVARWGVLLEEPQPREERQAATGSADGDRQVRPAYEERRAMPHATTRSIGGQRRKSPAKTAADQRAAESLRSRGIDPRSEIRQDDLDF
ncbi:hypothetical protein [Methylobacterium frigidaeris]|uniref:Uncharacterized protein n=1 Tax=Methylobacterium frigidaeris TaxID=2038277 RepID=A0AA37HHB1_9HYPH|nr:hypothetical protein [Methylobacterium frigidaeris]GJD65554.1 hypothetical protein MPEAHAMD_5749 [Methylobacterium frigidaeris]